MKRILALLLFLSPAVQAIVIDNGIPAGTEGHFSVDVLAGGDTQNATITAVRIDSGESVTTDVVANYISFVDPGQDGGGIGLSRSENMVGPTADPNVPNTVTSSGTFSGQFGEVSWNATSSISPGSQLMTTRYVFSATGDEPIGPLRVLQYLDEDVLGSADDVFLSRGSADSGDLSLYTFGNLEVIGVRQAGSQSFESFFAGWAAGPFRDILDRILGAGQPIAPEGVIADLPPFNHPQLGPSFGPEDVTSVLAWDINPNTFLADVVTVLGGEDAAPDPDPDPSDTPEANLSIIMSGTPNPATAHQPLIYTLTVRNNGPDPATSVGVTDSLPSDVAFVRATVNAMGGNCSGFPTVRCLLGTLQNGASAGVTIEVIPLEAGAVMNQATVYLNSTNEIDSTPGNNEARATIPVNVARMPTADLSLTMADSPDPGAVGERLTYTLTVTNNGPQTATSVQVTDSLPLAVEIGAPTGNCRGNRVVVCDLGTLASGASAIVPIEVIPTVAGAVTNEVVVNSNANVSDPVPGNNTVSASTSVNPSALVLPPQGRQNTCTGRRCEVRLTCALGTTCTNRVTLFARAPSGRLASDSSAKAARMIPFAFASVTNVPSGRTSNVRLTFTKRGRQIVSQLLKNGTRRLNGRIAISRSFRGGVSSLPATVRLRSKR